MFHQTIMVLKGKDGMGYLRAVDTHEGTELYLDMRKCRNRQDVCIVLPEGQKPFLFPLRDNQGKLQLKTPITVAGIGTATFKGDVCAWGGLTCPQRLIAELFEKKEEVKAEVKVEEIKAEVIEEPGPREEKKIKVKAPKTFIVSKAEVAQEKPCPCEEIKAEVMAEPCEEIKAEEMEATPCEEKPIKEACDMKAEAEEILPPCDTCREVCPGEQEQALIDDVIPIPVIVEKPKTKERKLKEKSAPTCETLSETLLTGQEKFEKLLRDYPLVQPFLKPVKDSIWVRIDCKNNIWGDHYIAGVINLPGEQLYGWGVPGAYSPTPPPGFEKHRWIQSSHMGALGYWVAYQSTPKVDYY